MKSFYQIMRTPLFDLNSNELKYYSLGIFILGVLFAIIESFFISLLLNSFEYLLISFIGFILGSFILSLWAYKRDWIVKKYNLKITHGIPNEMVVLMLFGASVILSSGISVIAFHQGGIYSAIAFCIANILPVIFMFFRINVYSNDDLVVNDEFGNVYLKQNGYNPIFFYVIGIMIGNGPMGFSLFKVLENIFSFNSISYYNLFLFILSVSFCFLSVSPDIMNKIVPFELNTADGFKKFFITSLIISGLLLLFFVE